MDNLPSRLLVLDVFRGFAAFSVLIYHLDKTHFPYGFWGVQFFFTISGFVIFKSLESSKNTFSFLAKRFFRLYPTYWLCVILTTLTVNFLPTDGFSPVSMKLFMLNLTMISEMLGGANIDSSYWSLQPELMFYLMIALIFSLKMEKKIVFIGLAWLFLILINHVFLIEKHLLVIKLLNIRHGGLFFAGMLFYQIYKGNQSKLVYTSLVLCYLVSLLVYARLFDFWGAFVTLSLIYALFSLFLRQQLTFLIHPYLVFLGSISYPLYLIHQTIGLILLSKLNAFLPFILSLGLVIFLLIIVAYGIHTFVEKPSSKWASKITN
jgi:peptidoglycan/LPS O-acetylase OafA/YrhL